jgi:hypothetical protein
MSGWWAGSVRSVARRRLGLTAVYACVEGPPSNANKAAGVQNDGGTYYVLCV